MTLYNVWILRTIYNNNIQINDATYSYSRLIQTQGKFIPISQLRKAITHLDLITKSAARGT